MPTTQQNELPLFADAREVDPNVPYLIGVLQGRDWTTAREVVEIVRMQTNVKWCDRKVRELAQLSKGQIAGGQLGYKLVSLMTGEEFHHARNWMNSQATMMQRRVVEMDRVFYSRKPVEVGVI